MKRKTKTKRKKYGVFVAAIPTIRSAFMDKDYVSGAAARRDVAKAYRLQQLTRGLYTVHAIGGRR
jgi:hypothetical protein